MKKLLIIFLVITFSQIGYAQVRTKGDVKPPSKTNRTTTSGAVGVNINLSNIFHSLKKNKNCNQVKIVYPKIKSNFRSDLKNPPTFKWRSSKPKLVKSYKVGFAILNGKEKTMLFQGDAYKTQIIWPKNIVWRDTKKGKTTYQFFVMALMKKGSKCKNVVESTIFTVTTTVPRVIAINGDVKVEDRIKSKNDSINNPSGGDETARGRRKARKACINSGGDFVESETAYICIHKVSSNLRVSNSNPDTLLRSKKRKCWKAGGNWITNASGSYCSRDISKNDKGVYAPGDAHYGDIAVNKSNKQKADVEVRGWNPKNKRVDHDSINNPSGGDETARGRRKARKACINSGGDFVESETAYICIHKVSSNLRVSNSNPDTLLRSKKRKCWKAGGNWITNASGSRCSRDTSKNN